MVIAGVGFYQSGGDVTITSFGGLSITVAGESVAVDVAAPAVSVDVEDDGITLTIPGS